jgi:hypothetical protein
MDDLLSFLGFLCGCVIGFTQGFTQGFTSSFKRNLPKRAAIVAGWLATWFVLVKRGLASGLQLRRRTGPLRWPDASHPHSQRNSTKTMVSRRITPARTRAANDYRCFLRWPDSQATDAPGQSTGGFRVRELKKRARIAPGAF